jgi:hypothetical protein
MCVRKGFFQPGGGKCAGFCAAMSDELRVIRATESERVSFFVAVAPFEFVGFAEHCLVPEKNGIPRHRASPCYVVEAHITTFVYDTNFHVCTHACLRMCVSVIFVGIRMLTHKSTRRKFAQSECFESQAFALAYLYPPPTHVFHVIAANMHLQPLQILRATGMDRY